MKTKLIALVSLICFFTNIPVLSAGTWVKKTTVNEGKNNSKSAIANDQTPETSSKGLFMKQWNDENDLGLSMATWLQNDKASDITNNEMFGNISDTYITHSYQWSERNPPLTTFTSEWTEAFYVQNKGNCDNRSLFNNKGKTEIVCITHFDFAGGPDDILDEDYGVMLTTTAKNWENKTIKNPKGYLRFGEQKSSEPSWLDKPDKGKSWQGASGDIISYAISTDNGLNDGIYNNIWFKGYGGGIVEIKLQYKAKNAYASLFHELSGFDLEMGQIISERTFRYPPIRQELDNNAALGQLKQIWVKAAQRSGLLPDSFSKVTNFLNQRQEKNDMQTLDENLLTESTKRYLDQFAYTFQGETEEQACYYIAWLLAEAAARPVVTSEEIKNTRVSFENLIDKLTSVLKENARQAIGDANSPEIQKELIENLARVKGKLLYYYYELSKDPLFLAFKKPIDKDIEAIIIKKFENEKILFNLLNNQIKTQPESEFYKKWLSFYFDRVAERVVFWFVVESNKDEFRNPQYWGGMHYRARSVRNGLWPVEIYLTRIDDK